MKPRQYWIVALCACVACAVFPARAAENADRNKAPAAPAKTVKAVKAATPAGPEETAARDQTMKLQRVTERRAKAMEATSNLMKKSSETSDEIIKNTK